MTINKTAKRNDYLCQEYLEGRSVKELARTYSLTQRMIRLILKEANISLRPRGPVQHQPVSGIHVLIGVRLADHMLKEDLDDFDAANQLEWPVIKLRRIVRGHQELEILEVQRIAGFLNMGVEELITR